MSTGATPTDPAAGHYFQQRLGLFDGTMMVAGIMIGSGIFLVSADISRDVGGAGWLLAVWALAGLMTILGALSYAELAAMMPHAGGQYVYLRAAYGPLPGFLYGWTSFLVIQTGTIAAVGVALAKFVGVFVPELGARDAVTYAQWQDDPAVLHGWKFAEPVILNLPLPWSAEPLEVLKRTEFTVSRGQLIGVAVIVGLTLWNLLGVREGKWVQNIFTVAKIGALLLLIGLGLTVAVSAEAIRANAEHSWSGIYETAQFRGIEKLVPSGGLLVALMVMGGAMVGALFSADAWNNVTFIAGEVKQPQRNLPRSLLLGTGLVITLYLLANLAYLASLPLHGDPNAKTVFDRGIAHAQADRVGTAVMERVSVELGAPEKLGAQLMALAIIVSTFGCQNGLILAGARLYYAMSRDRLFFQRVGTLSSRGVPAAALGFQCIWASLLVFSGTYNELLDYVIFAALLFYALTVGGLFVLRRTHPEMPRPYRVVGYPFLPALYVFLCAAVMLDLLVVKPKFTWPGLILVLSGIPVFFLWRKKARGAA
jgi:APA family basic amino acid/polyamine antiporter